MSTAALPVELLIEIFELTVANTGPEVGVFQQANQPTMANAIAATESFDDEDDDGDDEGDGEGDDEGEGEGEGDDEKWDEGHLSSNSDVESEEVVDWGISNEPTQGKEDEVQGPNAHGLLDTRGQGDGVKWSALKTCRL